MGPAAPGSPSRCAWVVFLTDVDDAALDHAVLEMSEHDKCALEWRGREHAPAFDRVFDDLFVPHTATVAPLRLAQRRASERYRRAVNAR